MTSIHDAETPFGMRLFGPMQVLLNGDVMPRLRSRKALWVVALLALRHGRDVERKWLAGTLWPDVDTTQALANLRPTLSEVRQALGAHAERLRTDGRLTVCLNLEGADVDLLRFDELIEAETLQSIGQAVEIYVGPLLEGCAEDWVFQERDSREQQCLRALVKLADHAYAAGDYGTAIEHSRRALRIDPLYESAHRRLMKALEQSGDRNSAMQDYREFADRLLRELNAVPDERTTDMYRRIRQAANPRGREERTAVETKAHRHVVPGYVPTPLNPLVGREDERLELMGKLQRCRLVTLTGLGGIGKTRLAIEVATGSAREGAVYADGVWFVGLESLPQEGSVASQVAIVLGVREEPGRHVLQSIGEHLRGKRVLLVLDNCEHMLEDSAKVAATLLQECAGVRILSTSREALGITGECCWAVPALTVPSPEHLPTKPASLAQILAGYESVQLFVDRAQAVQKSFALTGANATAVANVTARLEGIPLAIELAAARVRIMTVEQIASRLDDHLDILKGSSRAALSRQQTLRASLDWSHSLLTHHEQCLFRRLSVYAGGWVIEALGAVCADESLPEELMVDLLESLVDKSLVVFREHETAGSRGVGRFHLLDSVRQYAAEKLNESDETAQVRQRHQDYYVSLADEAERKLGGADQGNWHLVMLSERANLRLAMRSSLIDPDGIEAALVIAAALGKFWQSWGHNGEGSKILARALSRPGAEGRTAARAKALTAAGGTALFQGDTQQARAYHEESLSIFRELEDRYGFAWALNELGDVASSEDDNESARSFYEQSLAIFRELRDREGIASLVHHLARLERDDGNFEQARRLYEEGLATQKELGNEHGVGWALHHLGNLALLQGDFLNSWNLQEQAREILARLGNRQGVAWTLSELGRVATAQDDTDNAIALCEEGLRMFREVGNRLGLAAIFCQLGELAFKTGNFGEARRRYEESMAIRTSLGSRKGVLDCVLGIAEVEVAEGLLGDGVRLWAAATAMLGERTADLGLARRSRAMQKAKEQLGDIAFSIALSEGKSLTLDDAVSRVMRGSASNAPLLRVDISWIESESATK